MELDLMINIYQAIPPKLLIISSFHCALAKVITLLQQIILFTAVKRFSYHLCLHNIR